MAGRVRHLVQRGDGFWARVVVPKDLRLVIGKTELRVPLGSNRKIAERELHVAVAAFHDVLTKARAKLEVSSVVSLRARRRPLTLAQIAHTHYPEELALDEAERDHPDRAVFGLDMFWTRPAYTDALKLVSAGKGCELLSSADCTGEPGWRSDGRRSAV